MRKFLAVALSLAIGVCWMAGTAAADESDMNTKEVQVYVAGTFSMQEESPLQAGPPMIQLGEVQVMVPFRVDANRESVYLTAYVTELFKADEPESPHWLPIVLDANVLVDVHPELDPLTGETLGGNRVDGSVGNALAFLPDPPISETAPDGKAWNWWCTEEGLFESGHAGHFSHDIWLTVTWGNENAELPEGFYSGWVKLFGRLGPF
ncbi:MAG: hypothetical protein Kow0092_21690 [Deferrisomatales bacterium]